MTGQVNRSVSPQGDGFCPGIFTEVMDKGYRADERVFVDFFVSFIRRGLIRSCFFRSGFSRNSGLFGNGLLTFAAGRIHRRLIRNDIRRINRHYVRRCALTAGLIRNLFSLFGLIAALRCDFLLARIRRLLLLASAALVRRRLLFRRLLRCGFFSRSLFLRRRFFLDFFCGSFFLYFRLLLFFLRLFLLLFHRFCVDDSRREI